MAFNIPNEGDAAFTPQAEPDAIDFQILVAAFAGNGVMAGCAVTAQGSPDMTLAVAAGLIRYSSKSVVVAAGNVTITTADATNPRIDLVVVNNSGTKSVTAGTAAASPVCPAIPASSIVLAMVYVPANDTAIGSTQITDKRCTLDLPVWAYKAADETVNNSATLQDDDDLKFQADASSIWLVELTLLWSATSNTPDWKYAFTGPTSFTMYWAPMIENSSATAFVQYWGSITTASSAANGALSIESTTRTAGSTNGTFATKLFAIVFISSTAGTVQFQWAQNAATAADSKILKGSSLMARRLGT